MRPTSSGGLPHRGTTPWIPISSDCRIPVPPREKESDTERGWRRDTNDGYCQRSASEHDLPREARERARGAGVRQREDAQELHSDSAGGSSRGGSLSVRPDARADYLPVQITASRKDDAEIRHGKT